MTARSGGFLISAGGVLHHPSYPNIPAGRLRGRDFPLLAWDHRVERSGGIGVSPRSTGAQSLARCRRSRILVIFQRTRSGVPRTTLLPRLTAAIMRRVPALTASPTRLADYFSNLTGARRQRLASPVRHLAASSPGTVRDRALREKLTPDYRLCASGWWSRQLLSSVQRPNVASSPRR